MIIELEESTDLVHITLQKEYSSNKIVAQTMVDAIEDVVQKIVSKSAQKRIIFSVDMRQGYWGEGHSRFDFFQLVGALSTVGVWRDKSILDQYLYHKTSAQQYNSFLEFYQKSLSCAVLLQANIQAASPDASLLQTVVDMDRWNFATMLVDDKTVFHWLAKNDVVMSYSMEPEERDKCYQNILTPYMSLRDANTYFSQKNKLGYSPADIALYGENITFISKSFEMLDTDKLYAGLDVERYKFKDLGKKAMVQSFKERQMLCEKLLPVKKKSGFKL